MSANRSVRFWNKGFLHFTFPVKKTVFWQWVRGGGTGGKQPRQLLLAGSTQQLWATTGPTMGSSCLVFNTHSADWRPNRAALKPWCLRTPQPPVELTFPPFRPDIELWDSHLSYSQISSQSKVLEGSGLDPVYHLLAWLMWRQRLVRSPRCEHHSCSCWEELLQAVLANILAGERFKADLITPRKQKTKATTISQPLLVCRTWDGRWAAQGFLLPARCAQTGLVVWQVAPAGGSANKTTETAKNQNIVRSQAEKFIA